MRRYPLRALFALLIGALWLTTSVAQANETTNVPPAKPNDLTLSVPFRTQLDGTVWAMSNCGPASIAMVLEAFGKNVTNRALRDRANQLLGIASPNTGTRLQDLAQILREHGLETTGPYDVANPKKFRRWTLDEARQELREGRPLVVQTFLPYLPNHRNTSFYTDHYIVLVGTSGDDFIFNDPGTRKGYQLRLTAAELTRAWKASDFPFGGFSVGPGDTGLSLLPVPVALPEPILPAEGIASGVGPSLVTAPPASTTWERVDRRLTSRSERWNRPVDQVSFPLIVISDPALHVIPEIGFVP